MVAGEITAEYCYLQEVGLKRALLEARSSSGLVDLIEGGDLSRGKDAVGRGIWRGAPTW